MIGYLCGEVIEKTEATATILAGGVGYEVNVPVNVLSKLKKNEKTELWIYTHVREDIFALYGFADKESQNFFRLLLSVSGIGPKVALAIVSSAPLEKLRGSISAGDPSLLSAVSGVGRKTAEKAVVELRSKMGAVSTDTQIFSEEGDDAIGALVSLGFSRQEAAEAIAKLSDDISGADAKIREALKILGGK